MHAAVDQGEGQAVGGEPAGTGAGDPLGQPVAAQPGQVIAGLARAVGDAAQSGVPARRLLLVMPEAACSPTARQPASARTRGAAKRKAGTPPPPSPQAA